MGAFCNTFNLHWTIIGIENLFFFFFEWPLKTGFAVLCFQTEPDFLYIVFSTFNKFVECIRQVLLYIVFRLNQIS